MPRASGTNCEVLIPSHRTHPAGDFSGLAQLIKRPILLPRLRTRPPRIPRSRAAPALADHVRARRACDLITVLAARYHLPAVYNNRFFVDAGGLMSYGVVWVDQYRQAVSYVDRILRGAKPADLPVQTPNAPARN